MLFTGAGAAAVSFAAADGRPWTTEWDRVLLERAVASLDERYDPIERMLRARLDGSWRYHTNIRNAEVHPTRETLEYALALLELGRTEHAAAVIERVVDLQDTDAESKWYGIWGWYVEEPPPAMSPADWNWADFLGATLLEIEFRHGRLLEPSLRARVRAAIAHAARSVQRRNVSMNYTNIAVQGTFVVLAAAQLLDDDGLREYASDRVQRLSHAIDDTGSFAEYNSPTYMSVTIANLTRIRMYVRAEAALRIARALEHRAWLHLARHWHAATRQLSGPRSRAYSTDLGKPLWLQKALDNRVQFAGFEQLRGPTAVALTDWRCPVELVPSFTGTGRAREHRELFVAGPEGVRPVQGTTWLEPAFSLGSVNRGDFWVQRRPVLAYYARPGGAACYVQLRVLKDDYDFSSALLYSVQSRNYVLGLITFRSPGGDRHISLDPITDGQFDAQRLRVRLDFGGATSITRMLAGGTEAYMELTEDLRLAIQFREAAFGAERAAATHETEDGIFTLSLDLIRRKKTIRWADLKQAYVLFTLVIERTSDSLEDWRERIAGTHFADWQWQTPAGRLGIRGLTRVATVGEHDRAFREQIDGRDVPIVRLA
jgi:hypothetical protein